MAHFHGTVKNGAIAGHASPGHVGRVWFTLVQPGRYEFYYSVPGRRESGMVGVLSVADDPLLAGKTTFWESNGQITRRVRIP